MNLFEYLQKREKASEQETDNFEFQHQLTRFIHPNIKWLIDYLLRVL